jgi:trans-2,3-dihydro-3-hydroxyanthranilate isomerase
MIATRRGFLKTVAAGGALTAVSGLTRPTLADAPTGRRFAFVQIDVFTAHRLQGNALAVFPDARGLTDAEMQDLARETNLQETTFVFPRDPAIEQQRGIQVRIFIPNDEIPFAGHPTLGTAMVLRDRALAAHGASPSEIALDLKVGKIPVAFRTDEHGEPFGEMHQIDPVFGAVHDRAAVADVLDVKPADLVADWPIQTVSTGLRFIIVAVKDLRTLQALSPDPRKLRGYLERHDPPCDFYFVTRDTQDADVGLRARAIAPDGEDPATGSAAGCTAAWSVRYGVAKPGQTVHILQGVEVHRPSHIYVRADATRDKVVNVRVGGNAIAVMEGEVRL